MNLYVQCSKNNTRLTLTSSNGNVISSLTPSQIGFTKALRSAPNSAYEITLKMISTIENLNVKLINVLYFKGIGPGRTQVVKALTKAQFDINKVIDITTFPYNGCRPKKARRLKRLT